MIKHALIALALTGAVASAQAGVVVNEGFNDVTTLGAKGWVMTNASTPGGLTGWFQGDQSAFAAQAGPAASYIAANYNNAPVGGTLNNWLITPEFSNETPVFISLWLRGAADAGYSDQVAFGFSANGGSSTADFTVATPFTVPTNDWTRYDLYFGARGAGATGRFAIQYTGAADDSNYIGVDSLTVTVPEPSTMLVMMTGLMGVAAVRRRQRR